MAKIRKKTNTPRIKDLETQVNELQVAVKFLLSALPRYRKDPDGTGHPTKPVTGLTEDQLKDLINKLTILEDE